MNNTITNIKLKDLTSAPDNPFKVTMDAEMERLIESIAESGLIAPIIARETENGKYEIVSGHRRKYACEYLGIETVPVILKELDRNEAVIFLVDSNLQRENILPSERAFAYKMKRDALAHQGSTSPQVGEKLLTVEKIGSDCGDSKNQVLRYIRLTNLIPELLQLVDEKKIALTPAVEISYLTEQEQYDLLAEIERNDCTPSLSQACRFKKLSQENNLTKEQLSSIMLEDKANQKEMFKLPMERIQQIAPKINPSKMEAFVLEACQYYMNFLNRKRDRGDR